MLNTGDLLKYRCLTQLLSGDVQARRYFLSLPTDLQLELHKLDGSIRTSQELYEAADNVNRGNNYYRGFENRSFYI